MADAWPIAAFYFKVTFGSDAPIGFQEVSGLDQSVETLEYRHGKSLQPVTMKRAGMVRTDRLVFKKGIFSGDSRLLTLFNEVFEGKTNYPRADYSPTPVLIELLDETGTAVVSWNVPRAIPVKLSTSAFRSTANEIAIETLEFVHDGIQVRFS
ncbi:MAG: phage tail protein [Bacteroidia bacterium]|nr:phage tail protein [Bacteroidia bacterium]